MKNTGSSTTPILRFQIPREFRKKYTIHHVLCKLFRRHILFLYPISSLHTRGIKPLCTLLLCVEDVCLLPGRICPMRRFGLSSGVLSRGTYFGEFRDWP